MIDIEHVSRVFGTGPNAVTALQDVSLHVPAGSIFGVVGQSGAGKSTLLRMVNALDRPDAGRVRVNDQTISNADPRGTAGPGIAGAALAKARHDIGMVFQHFNLVGNRTVAQNVEFALEATGTPRSRRRPKALEMLDLVGLAHRADDRPAQLSGGQRQRVGIARALASEPRILLSDEATSALDPETTRQILDLIKRLSRELGLTVMLITHEMDVVKRICDSTALMEHGRVIESGTLEALIGTRASRVSQQLFPVGEHPPAPGNSVVDITYSGLDSNNAVIARTARALDLDLSILGAAMETVNSRQMGRTRLAVPGGDEQAQRVVDAVSRPGITAWIVQEDAR
ncbi:MAG TPA: ATP-binding cassette domain-containing protein [Candidatus Agrococcus pullicola]|uniref:ATP-binding cassette domain-containing protein n=1 Tax=Candidatus Agrococcus pullicola TaxID=2838429 RepID=A0A9D1Z0E4_9MICO|nr:ATP-binding cassette domain-containing protein [Candidatus Agrococcus pullicola]